MKKKMVSDASHNILSDIDELSFENVKKMLDDFVLSTPEGSVNFRLSVDYEWTSPRGYAVLYMKFDRPETDFEFQARIRKEQKEEEKKKEAEEKKKERELKEFKRLKKKYGEGK